MIPVACLTLVVVLLLVVLCLQQRAHADAEAAFWKSAAIDVVNQFAYYIPNAETGCWDWQKAKDKNGYGRVRRINGRSGLAHRLSYERARGPIPAGLVLDHLCCNTSCINPAHLEPVTSRENTRRWRVRNPEAAAEQFRRAQAKRHP